MFIHQYTSPPFAKGRAALIGKSCNLILLGLGLIMLVYSLVTSFLTEDLTWVFRLESTLDALLWVGILGVWFFISVSDIWFAGRRERRVVTKNSLALQLSGRKTTYINCRDCVALTDKGHTLILRDGRHIELVIREVPETAKANFLKRFYGTWWPGLTPEHVEQELQATEPHAPRPVKFFRKLIWVLALGGVAVGLLWSVAWCVGMILSAVVLASFLWSREAKLHDAEEEHRYELPAEYRGADMVMTTQS